MKISNRIIAALLCFVLLIAATAPALTVFAVESISACDCGSSSTDLSSHADSCARKSYIRSTYIKNNTAEQIYSDWNSLDSDVQAAVLEILSWDDYAKLVELQALIAAGGSGSDGYPTTGSENINVKISVPTDAFPDGTTSHVEPIDAKEYCSVIESAISDIDTSAEVLALYAFDISFVNGNEKVQPTAAVELTFTVPAELVPAEVQTAMVFHIGDDGVSELVAENYDIIGGTEQTLRMDADSFSSYVIAFTGQKYQATLLRDALSGSDRYSIATFPVTLYDYDSETEGKTINDYFASKANGQEYFYFWGGGNNAFLPNDGAAAATMGILESELVNGLPSMVYGYDNGADIFGTEEFDGKKVYENVEFEFIYDKVTGYYEYNSALNHAQYNSTSNRIELYTDTMGAYNYYKGINQTTPQAGSNCKQTREAEKDSDHIIFEATGSNPQITVDHTNRAISVFEYVYIRLYSNNSENNGFKIKLYFSNGGNATITLDLKSGWNEYYFDMGSYSGKELAMFEIYPGSAADTKVEISRLGFIQVVDSNKADKVTEILTDMSYAGFFPFAKIKKSYPNQYSSFDITTWETNLKNVIKDVRSTRSYYNAALTNYLACPTETLFHTGVQLKFDVYLPIGYDSSQNGKDDDDDLIFKFSGDDDLWVFIDGKLALDVGGAHSQIDGVINFTEGTVSVSNARTITASNLYSGNSTIAASAYNGILDSNLKTTGYHTIQVFYLERASTGSNCRFYFNLPTIPTGDVEVSKQVVDESGLVDLTNLQFEYTIEVENVAYANKTYSVITRNSDGSIASTSNATTTTEGKFYLKHNQTAYFNGIDENKLVKVTEADYSKYFTTKVDGKLQLDYSATTANGVTMKIPYVNTVLLTSIIIKKTAKGVSPDVDIAENQSFIFNVKGTAGTITSGVDVNIVININSEKDGVGSGEATIVKIPVGSYTVTEDPNWSWRYETVTAPTEQPRSVTQEYATDYNEKNYFRFVNSRNKRYWLSGDNIATNTWSGVNVEKRQKEETID